VRVATSAGVFLVSGMGRTYNPIFHIWREGMLVGLGTGGYSSWILACVNDLSKTLWVLNYDLVLKVCFNRQNLWQGESMGLLLQAAHGWELGTREKSPTGQVEAVPIYW